MPGVVVSLLLIAAGAILSFAVTATVTGVDIEVVGVVLMLVGALGLVLSILFMMSLLPWGPTRTVEYHDDYRP